MIDISSLVLFASDLDASTRFYRTVGVPLEDEEHDDGPVHAACEIGPVHVAVYQAEEPRTVAEPVTGPWRSAGSVFAGFYVDSLDATTAAGRPGRGMAFARRRTARVRAAHKAHTGRTTVRRRPCR